MEITAAQITHMISDLVSSGISVTFKPHPTNQVQVTLRREQGDEVYQFEQIVPNDHHLRDGVRLLGLLVFMKSHIHHSTKS